MLLYLFKYICKFQSFSDISVSLVTNIVEPYNDLIKHLRCLESSGFLSFKIRILLVSIIIIAEVQEINSNKCSPIKHSVQLLFV
jgi:hypothetical protein